MPPPSAPSVLALRALRRHAFPRASQRFCYTLRFPQRRDLDESDGRGRRSISHAAPVTSVNAIKRIPTPFIGLHGALKQLEQTATNYANLTQLQLALRGLESEDATIRVAVLGLGTLDGAKQLIRNLLADPLASEQAWENALATEDDDTAVLVRYGEEFGVDERNPLLRVLSIPSIFLKNHRLEILLHRTDAVTRASPTTTDTMEGTESLLDLDLGAAAFSAGRAPRMLYPVHRTVVLGDGLRGAQDVFRILEGSGAPQDTLQGVVNVRWEDAASESSLPNVAFINVTEATTAIALFRESLGNAFKYEHGWLNSNIDALQGFLSLGTSTGKGVLKPVLRDYIEMILAGAEAAVVREQTEQLSALALTGLGPGTRDELLNALTAWAEFAHTELRDEFDIALQSRTWRKIAWWKLVWRVDDIGLVMSDVLQRSYLVNAERYLLWIGGYFRSEGLLLADHPSQPVAIAENPAASQALGTIPTDDQVVRMMRQDINDAQVRAAPARMSTASTLNAEETSVSPEELDLSSPWPQQIAASRNRLLNLIPPLQLQAQGIVVRTLSTSGLAAAIGGLSFVGVSDTSVYSACGIAAFGAAWALGAAQKQWNRATDQWAQDVRAEGKRVLEACERRGRHLVEQAERESKAAVATGGEGAAERTTARTSIASARKALDDVSGSPND